jgi:hypothetical protein
MDRLSKLLGLFIMISWGYGCASLRPTLQPATSVKNASIEGYKYIYVSPTNSLTSSSGFAINGDLHSITQTVNPTDLITGIFIKEGLIRLPELKPELAEETIIINYGQSGKRNTGLGGYTLEVTIQLISAKTSTLVCSCTAEGQGLTEADDIRQAITRCLNELTPVKNN